MSAKVETAKNLIARVSGRDAAALDPGQDLIVDLGIDSPKALELLVEIEEAFKIEISDEDAAALESVGDILTYVEALD